MAKFEEALKAMREGKKVSYGNEIYWIDTDEEPQTVFRYEYDWNDGCLDTETVCPVRLFGADLLSEDWEIVDE